MQKILQAPVLDLRGEIISCTLDLRDTFHQLNLCPEEDETHAEQCPSEEEQLNPMLRTSEEEIHFRTIHGSALATQISLSHSRAQTNQTVERGPSCKVKIMKLPKDKAADKSTQTTKEIKQTK